MIPARLLVLLVLLVTPWWFGAVEESVQVYVFVAIAGACLCALFARRDEPIKLPLVLVPLAAGIALGLFQLCPLPKPIARLVSSHTVQLREELLLDQGADNSDDATQPTIRHTVSLRPAATRYDLSLLVLATAGLLLGSQLFATGPSRLLLCWAVAVNGALLAFFGLLQRLTWNGRLYWIGPIPENANCFASFVNRNNGGGYLNLCLAAAVVLMLWTANRDTQIGGSPRETASFSRRQRSRHGGSSHHRSNLDALKIASAALAAIIVGGILCTLSRGAGIALLVAAIVTAVVVLVTGQKRLRTGGGVIVLLAGIGLVGWVGMRDAFVERVGTLAESEELVSSGRVPNWQDALRSVPDFWLTGSGLGTYRDIYLLYQQRYDSTWYYYAENQYVQAVVEAGIPGLLLLLLALAAVVAAIGKQIRSASDPFDYALAVGGLFAVVSQAIHGFLDFGLYVPANMLLMAVICGAVTAKPGASSSRDFPFMRNLRRLEFWAGARAQRVLVGMLLLGVLLGARQVRAIAATNAALSDADYSTAPGVASEADLQYAVDTLQARLPQSADDAELHYELAKAWIYLQRIQAFSALRRTSPSSMTLDQLWDLASTIEQHRKAYEFLRAGETAQLDALRAAPGVTEHLVPALQHLRIARQSCPILAKIHLRLARLSFLEASLERDAVHADRARRLAPSDPYTFVECGLLDLQAGRIDAARQSWRHALALSEAYAEDVLTYARAGVDFETIVTRVLPPSPTLLLQLAQKDLSGSAGIAITESRPLLLQRAEELAVGSDLPEDQRHHLLAAIYELRGDYAAALSEYKKAVELQPFELTWRHEYGRLLFQEGQLDEAHEQIRWCARREPDSLELRRLLEAIVKARLSR